MQRNDTFSMDIVTEHKIHELIFVNSGSNYYTRLPVDEHAALLSDNNSGKTSTLSALKLFVLPETSFKNCKEKFGFVSGGTFYSDLDSFQYYFPSTESYVICNASNPKGNFCWIVYRTTGLGYDRIAIPKSYDEISHIFWNTSSRKNEGAGQLQADIGINEVKKRLLSAQFGGTLFTDRKIIGEAIYTRTSSANDHTRFSLLPMAKKFSASSVDTVRALFGMAFSLTTASTSTLPDAIGAIIDGMGMSVVKSKDDGIFLDLDSALDEWAELKAIGVNLSKVVSFQNTWSRLKEDRETYVNHREVTCTEFATLAISMERVKNELGEKVEQCRKITSASEGEMIDYNTIHRKIEEAYRQNTSDLKSVQENLTMFKQRLKGANEARSQLLPLCPGDDKSDAAVLVVLNQQITLCEEDIQNLRDTAKALVSADELNLAIKQDEESVSKMELMLEKLKQGKSLLDDLDIHSAAVLKSLNPVFAESQSSPSSKQRATIDEFAGLFDNDLGRLVFCGSVLGEAEYVAYDVEETKEKIASELHEKKQYIRRDKDRLHKITSNARLTKTEQESKLQECQAELVTLRSQKEDLKGVEVLASMLDEENIKVNELELVIGESRDKFEGSELKTKSLRLKHDNDRLAEQDITGPLTSLDAQIKNLKIIEARSGDLLDYDAAIKNKTNSEPAYELEEFDVVAEKVSDSLLLSQTAWNECVQDLMTLVDNGIIKSEPEDRHAMLTKPEYFEMCYSSIQTVYETLGQKEENYKQRLSAHNNIAATSARIIENVRSIIENFVSSINQELSGYRISNLDSVELTVELHPQYTNMVASLASVSSSSDVLLSEDFYKQIAEFQNQFYIRRTGKIDIPKIIEKIAYRFNINGEIEVIPQSNGTNCMVNAVLLALLLKRMVPEDLTLTIPVIFDEVGSLDEHNLTEVLKVMEEHGLILFAANPTSNGVIASVLSVQHHLSIFRATDVGIHGKAETIYFPGMEDRLSDDTQNNALAEDAQIA